MNDHHMIRAFAHAVHASTITTEQTLLLSHLASTPHEHDRTTACVALALKLHPITVGRRLKQLHAHDLIDRPTPLSPFHANEAGRTHLRDLASNIKNALKKALPPKP